MTVTSPPRPPRSPSEPLDREELEALVEALFEEARQRARRRRRRRGALAILVGLVGVGLFAVLDRAARSESGAPAFSARTGLGVAASSRMAFTQSSAGGQGHGALYLVNPDGSGKRRVVETAGHATPSWSPDGRRIVFQTKSGPGLTVVNADGSGQQRLTIGTHPAWSPDGQRIAFGRADDKQSGWDIFVMNADGSEQRRLVRHGTDPRWSPDGRTIAFVRRATLDGFNYDIYAVDGEGGPARGLARSPAYENDPAWSPDGRRIAFVRGNDIWLMNADGSGPRRLTSGAARDRAPSWSPDGRTIAFDRRVGSIHEIYVMNADGSGQRRLALGGAGRPLRALGATLGAGPLWSPDGKQIAYSRALGNGPGFIAPDNWEIFVMNADGTDQRNVSRNRRFDDCCFAWSPAQK